MSRYYANRTIVTLPDNKVFSKEEIQQATDIFDLEWNADDCIFDPKNRISLEFYGESSLAGGEREDEAHLRFVKAFRGLFPDCGVETIWTYLEDLPTETYTTEPGEKVS